MKTMILRILLLGGYYSFASSVAAAASAGGTKAETKLKIATEKRYHHADHFYGGVGEEPYYTSVPNRELEIDEQVKAHDSGRAYKYAAEVSPSFSPIDVIRYDIGERLTAVEFARKYATQGRPLVVRGAMGDWNVNGGYGWSPHDFRERFPGEVHNRRPFVGEELFNDGEFAGLFTQEMFDSMKDQIPAFDAADFLSRKHISWRNENPEVSKWLLKDAYKPPLFVRPFQGVTSGWEYFFFGQDTGQGREMHIDYSCNSTWSMQVIGRKIWRLYSPLHPSSVFYQETLSESSNKDYADGEEGVAYEVVLNPGDVIVWYPAYAHETYQLDENSTALSVEFRLPPPTAYLQKHKKRFELHSKKYHSFTRCFPLWDERAAFYEKAIEAVLLAGSGGEGEMENEKDVSELSEALCEPPVEDVSPTFDPAGFCSLLGTVPVSSLLALLEKESSDLTTMWLWLLFGIVIIVAGFVLFGVGGIKRGKRNSRRLLPCVMGEADTKVL